MPEMVIAPNVPYSALAEFQLRLVAKVSSQDTGSKHHVTAAVHTATARPTPAAYVPINSVVMLLNNVPEMIIQISF